MKKSGEYECHKQFKEGLNNGEDDKNNVHHL
jgi:hypothetical protein